MSLDPALVGERIAAAREAKGWTQLTFALEAGISPSTVQRWEAGKLPPVRRLLEVAELLGVEPEALVEPRESGDHELELLRHLEALEAAATESSDQVARALEGIAEGIARIEERLSDGAAQGRKAQAR